MQTPKNLPYHTIINAPPFTFFIIVFPLSIVYNLSCVENSTYTIECPEDYLGFKNLSWNSDIKIPIEASQHCPYRYKKQSETHYKLHIKLSHYLKRTMKIMLVFSGQHINPSYFHTHISPYLYDLLL